MGTENGMDKQRMARALSNVKEKLRADEPRVIAMVQVLRWLTSNGYRVGVLRGDAPILKMLGDWSKDNWLSAQAMRRMIEDGVSDNDELPF